MKELQGKWNYQSFIALPAIVDRTQSPPDIKRAALIAAPWTPPSIMEFSTDSAGKVLGSAKLGLIEFRITGSVTIASDSIPEGIELTITVERTSTAYLLRGYFLNNSDHIVGAVVAISNDLGFQPPGSSGPFVLYPANS
jgi:hypothetical protein